MAEIDKLGRNVILNEGLLMTIDKKTVKKISNLAHLKLSEEEVSSYSKQFEEILKYVNKLEELDTENIEPLSHIHDLTNVMREDEVESSKNREKYLDNAPAKKGPYFQVPRVIGDE